MTDDILKLCNRLDQIREEQDALRARLSVLNQESMSLDGELNKILHAHIDPLLKGHWSARITLYKDGHRG